MKETEMRVEIYIYNTSTLGAGFPLI